MDLSEFEFIWKEKKNEYALVKTEWGYNIVNIKEHSAVLIGDDTVDDAVVEKMITEKMPIFDDINVAFDSYDD